MRISKVKYKQTKGQYASGQSLLTSCRRKSVMRLSRCVTALSSQAYLRLKSSRHCLIEVSISPLNRAIIEYWQHRGNFTNEVVSGADRSKRSQQVIRQQARIKSTHGISLTYLQRFEANTITCMSSKTSTAEKSWVMKCMSESAVNWRHSFCNGR